MKKSFLSAMHTAAVQKNQSVRTPYNHRRNTAVSFIRIILACASLLLTGMSGAFAQNKFPATGAVGIGTITPNASSLLDVVSTSKGVLIPRMTLGQRNNIVAPATSLLIYQTDRLPGFYYYNGSAWVALAGTGGGTWANTSLSNLKTTSVNQPLIPITTNMIDLGSASVRWNTLYAKSGDFGGDVNIAGDVYKGSLRVMAFKDDNTSIGIGAFPALSGIYNTALGSNALHANVSGGGNTAYGAFALQYNNSGSGNIATGSQALMFNISGYGNVAVGGSAMIQNIDGGENTAVGGLALASNQNGKGNVAMGSNALYNSNTDYVVAVGDYAFEQLKTGVQDVALGSKAGNQTKGSYNSYVGYNAGFFDNTSDNTAIGNLAGWKVANGAGCTYVGSNAGPTTAGLTNTTGIGYNVTPTASNQVRIGNSAVTSIGGQVSWSSLSDGRFKRNMKENVPGLAFINLLKPLTYTFDHASIRKFRGEEAKGADGKAAKDASLDDKLIHTGFVAQDVEAAAKKMNFDFDGVDAPKNDKDAYGIRYAEFVVPLVKAVQELSKINDDKDSRINDLEERLAKVEALLSSKTATVSGTQSAAVATSAKAAFLEQNTPNPSGSTTTIRYTLPQQYSKAQILVMDNQGRTIQNISLTSNKGSVQVDVSKLSAGSYRYSLLVDNTIVAAKQMIVSK